ncbi:MAG TPA: carboxypeptidase-like regulatory domain-containing protein [Bacteroidota bacterium]|nr:carboxypeptidase-like regulatory domain-containing protein [Bacteroidota bacterium]
MRVILCLISLCLVSVGLNAQVVKNPMVISGYVRDFDDHPLDSANVLLQDRTFNPVAQTVTDSTGHYVIRAEKRDYMALLAIRMSDYAKSRLEYWAWNIPPADTLMINPRYHRLEVYGLNAFAVQGSGSRSVFIYFRPMSLTRQAKWLALHDTAGTQLSAVCSALAPKDISVTIDGRVSKILDLDEVKETTKTGFMRGYLIQCALPESRPTGGPSRIVLTVTDPENSDKGEGLLFWSGQ